METQLTRSELKKRANLAKKRMQIGYWDKVKADKDMYIANKGENVYTEYWAKNIQVASHMRQTNIQLGSETERENELMYNKVCAILENDEIVTNPLGLLVEHNIYDRMTPVEKQRYILILSKKFCEFKERYKREKLSKVSSSIL